MSLKSMTGHGRGTAAAGGIKVEVDISTVNRKMLDVNVSLPRPLMALAPRVEEEIGLVLSRGRVSGDIAVQLSPSARRRGVCVDAELAAAYLDKLRRAARRLKLEDDFDSEVLIALPDVVRYEQPERETERMWPIVRAALSAALKSLSKMREREGAALRKDLEKRIEKLAAHLDVVRKHAPDVVNRYREKLLARLKAAEIPLNGSDDRLLREIALFADRSDISEEVTRLESHFKQARQMMSAKEPVGRSLDFLVQEMFREANTMGSKANDGAILREVVAIKAELERVREQVQNIE